ncbi:hypothetical protein LXM94_03680 [Rhizobium sp. TRM95111]|nr:hypothetical protein [Rhizobium alarense]MCF3639062.1 hypothetical protein [Rhizobium alarense]
MPKRAVTIALLLALATLAGCASTANENTTYARPANQGGALLIPLD